MSDFSKFVSFMWTRKRYWLAPFIFVILWSVWLMFADDVSPVSEVRYHDF